jgi:ABC-type sulfate transport system permease component
MASVRSRVSDFRWFSLHMTFYTFYVFHTLARTVLEEQSGDPRQGATQVGAARFVGACRITLTVAVFEPVIGEPLALRVPQQFLLTQFMQVEIIHAKHRGQSLVLLMRFIIV